MNHRCSVLEACKPLLLSNQQLREISELMLTSIQEGLNKDTHEQAAVRCFQTYVQDFPSGEERGTFMALDLGGTNFRILSVMLSGKQRIELLKETYAFPDKKKHGTAEEMFDHIAECIINFSEKHKIDLSIPQRIPLGFTFSFPVAQTGLNKGILIKWTKSFSASGVVGKDVVQLLKDALERKNISEAMTVVALLNDTVGTLMSCALENTSCRIGLICGTGNNACYAEKIENIQLFNGDPNKPFMIINTEWGNFGADGKLQKFLTEYDIELIEASSHKYNQTFEKCIAGKYVGETMRLIIMKLVSRNELFNGQVSEILQTPYAFQSKYLSTIENDPEFGPMENTEKVVKEIGITDYNEQDLYDLYFISKCVITRSASLVSTGIACLLNKMGLPSVDIGVDGSLYRKHPHYADIMTNVTRHLTRKEINFKYVLSDDGSGRGAAFVAATAQSS